MIKILFLIDTLTGGGAEKVLRTLVNNMDQQQFQITVQTVEQTDAGQYLVPGIRYKAINRARTPLGRKLFSYWLRLCAELKWIYPMYIKDDYDIEVAYLECGPTKFLSGSTNRKALKLAWVHCDLEQKGTVATRKLKKIYRAYDKVVCVSENSKDVYCRLFGEETQAVILHNVNDEEEIRWKSEAFPVTNPDSFTFLSVGRLSHQKGYDRLLDACKLLKDQGAEFRLQILGEGPERQALETQMHALNLQDQVTLAGFQSNPYPYMKAADCIVCASRYEGFSTVVTEALILGKPVITTPCSGMDELLGDSQYGIITEHSAESISRAMLNMLRNPLLCARYAEAASRRGKEFSKENVLNQTQQFFLSEWKAKQKQN